MQQHLNPSEVCDLGDECLTRGILHKILTYRIAKDLLSSDLPFVVVFRYPTVAFFRVALYQKGGVPLKGKMGAWAAYRHTLVDPFVWDIKHPEEFFKAVLTDAVNRPYDLRVVDLGIGEPVLGALALEQAYLKKETMM